MNDATDDRPMLPILEPLARAGRQPLDCPDVSLLSAAAEGVLPEPLAARVRAHVERCAICRALQSDLSAIEPAPPTPEELAHLDRSIRAKTGRGSGRGPWVSAWMYAAAAAAVAAVAISPLFLPVSNVPAAREPSAAPLPSPAPLQPPALLVATKLPVTLGVEALTWRGEGPAAYEVRLAQALAGYADDDYDAAIVDLTRLVREHPDRSGGWLYLGVSHLMKDAPGPAAEALRRAAAIPDGNQDDARWYLAVAEHRLGNNRAALSVLYELCASPSRAAPRACAAGLEVAR